KDGKDRYTTEIVGEKMQMLSAKGDGGGRSGGGRSGGEPTAAYDDPVAYNQDDDIPF
ncbi:MAG TPA: single-stranded DNA-binding protein, partial [Geobacteraceae bacterium]|nr:single-stranded DNA-binding protein [Geobacteraceae bacterium]